MERFRHTAIFIRYGTHKNFSRDIAAPVELIIAGVQKMATRP
jgi:hypothetical protein